MSKLNEADTTPRTPDVGNDGVTESRDEETGNVVAPSSSAESMNKQTKSEDDKKDILRFTMLFNKYNSDLDMKKRADDEVKFTMFFNKEVTISSKVETPGSASKNSESKKPGSPDSKDPTPGKANRRSKFSPKLTDHEFGKPQISEPEMMFPSSLTSPSEAFDGKKTPRNHKKAANKRNAKSEADSLVQLNVHPAARTDLRMYNSLPSLSRNSKLGGLKSKIPSLTAIETNSASQKSSLTKFSYWDQWDELMQSDFDRRLNLQVSWSSNDNNNRRSTFRFKKEDAASASDSKLLYADYESKKQIKKCDKKSRGDSSKKERDTGGRKQVQWKTEVDVIYFSTHQAANGDRTGEVIGRVMEPLREEWEQQRKGFYAKMVPYTLETHQKYRFISLLQM